MKKILFLVLTLLIVLSINSVFAEEFGIHNTAHFEYSAPDGWHKQVSENSIFHYGKNIGSVDGGYIAALEMEDASLLSYADDLDTYYNAIINAMIADDKTGLMIQEKEIDGHSARLVLGTLDTGNFVFDAAYALVIVDQYILCQSYIDPKKDPNDLFTSIDRLSDDIKFVDGRRSIKSADLLFEEAVQATWPNNVLSAHAGKYPDITVYESGSSTGIKTKSKNKILALLREVDKIRKETDWQFADIFIRIHTDLVDIYGNEMVGEVITVRFTPETLDKTNYDKVLEKNIPLIADVWREHPALSD